MRRLALLALLGVALAGCGGDDAPREGSGAAGAAADTAEPGTGPAVDPDTPTSSDGDDGAASRPPGSTAAPPSSGGGSSGSSGATRPREARPLPGLPGWTAGYRGWTRLNAMPIQPTESDPHLGTKNVFASTRGGRGLYPAGTIVVKEAYRPGKDFIGLVATMRKLSGRDPEHNDWVFIEWARDSASEPFRELARGDVCTSCHVGVADQDYVFTTG